MSDASNTWKLIDMDNAKEIGKDVMGHTARYCPPEAAKKDIICKADPALDIWAFGVVSFLSLFLFFSSSYCIFCSLSFGVLAGYFKLFFGGYFDKIKDFLGTRDWNANVCECH